MRNSRNFSEELAKAEAQWLTVPDWDAPKRRIRRRRSLYACAAGMKKKAAGIR